MATQGIQAAARPPAAIHPQAMVRILAVAVVVLLGSTLALGAMLLQPAATSPGTAIADDMIAAWNERDLDAVRAAYTDDAFLWQSASATVEATGIDEIVEMVQYGGLTIERIGPVAEQDSLLYYPVHVTTTFDVQGDNAAVVLVLEDGKIAQHWVVWG